MQTYTLFYVMSLFVFPDGVSSARTLRNDKSHQKVTDGNGRWRPLKPTNMTRKTSTYAGENARKTAMHACGIVGRRPRVRLYRSSYDGDARLRANVYEAWLCSECEIRTLTLPTLAKVEDSYYE